MKSRVASRRTRGGWRTRRTNPAGSRCTSGHFRRRAGKRRSRSPGACNRSGGDGKELFYISADGKLTAVPVTTDGATFSAGTSHALFDVEVPEPNAPYPTDYAVTADGQRFLVNTVVDQATRPALTVILNWTAGLKK